MFKISFDIDLDPTLIRNNGSKKDWFYRFGSIPWWPKKHWEIQITRWPLYTLFSLEFDFRFRGQDHAGPKFRAEILGVMVDIHMYDQRHWDHDENKWEEHDD